VTRIKIPADDPAFEINGDDAGVLRQGNEILIDIISELIDLDGLKANTSRQNLPEF